VVTKNLSPTPHGGLLVYDLVEVVLFPCRPAGMAAGGEGNPRVPGRVNPDFFPGGCFCFLYRLEAISPFGPQEEGAPPPFFFSA